MMRFATALGAFVLLYASQCADARNLRLHRTCMWKIDRLLRSFRFSRIPYYKKVLTC